MNITFFNNPVTNFHQMVCAAKALFKMTIHDIVNYFLQTYNVSDKNSIIMFSWNKYERSFQKYSKQTKCLCSDL